MLGEPYKWLMADVFAVKVIETSVILRATSTTLNGIFHLFSQQDRIYCFI